MTEKCEQGYVHLDGEWCPLSSLSLSKSKTFGCKKALEIKSNVLHIMKTNLQAAFEVKTLDVKTVSVRSSDKSVLEVRHDLLPVDVGHDHHVPHQPGCPPDCPLHAEMSLKVFDVSLSESSVSDPSLALAPSRAATLPLIFHLHIESVTFHNNPGSFGLCNPNR